MGPRPHIAFVDLTEGELEASARAACESTLFERLEASRVAVEMVAINTVGCFFTVDEQDIGQLRTAAASLNVAVRLRRACAWVSLRRGSAKSALPSLARVLCAIGARDVEVVHVTSDAVAVDVVVSASDAAVVADVLASFCRPHLSGRVA
jgi:aspartokinase